MERTPVTSSNVRSVGYDADTQTLEVEFASGGVYAYSGVPPEEHEVLMAAESIGMYLAQHIKPAYPSQRVGTTYG